jgi:hypothetical protein
MWLFAGKSDECSVMLMKKMLVNTRKMEPMNTRGKRANKIALLRKSALLRGAVLMIDGGIFQ